MRCRPMRGGRRRWCTRRVPIWRGVRSTSIERDVFSAVGSRCWLRRELPRRAGAREAATPRIRVTGRLRGRPILGEICSAPPATLAVSIRASRGTVVSKP